MWRKDQNISHYSLLALLLLGCLPVVSEWKPDHSELNWFIEKLQLKRIILFMNQKISNTLNKEIKGLYQDIMGIMFTQICFMASEHFLMSSKASVLFHFCYTEKRIKQHLERHEGEYMISSFIFRWTKILLSIKGFLFYIEIHHSLVLIVQTVRVFWLINSLSSWWLEISAQYFFYVFIFSSSDSHINRTVMR